MPDKDIVCKDCQETFTFTEGEQEFYKTKNFSEPKRCKECRLQAKENRDGKRTRRASEE